MGFDLDRLGDYFDADSVEWRLQNGKPGNQRGLAVPYVTNRAIMDRLDTVAGPLNWKNEFRPWHRFKDKDNVEVVGQLCGIYIYDPDRKEWVDKWDGAQLSAIEPLKGGLSDAMKRAAVQWNIGRYLYRMDAVWVDIEPSYAGAKTMKMTKSAVASLPGIYMEMLDKLKANIPIAIPNRIALGMDDPSPQWEGEPEGSEPARQAQQSQPQGQPTQQGAKGKQVRAKKETQPGAAQSQGAGVYIVVERSGTLVANNAHIKLQTPEGEVRNAFLRGARPEITKGTRLINVRMTPRREGSYAYFSVDSCDVAA